MPFPIRLLAALLPLLCLTLCAAADVPAEIQSAIDRTHSVPGEFAADALLRIAALETLDSAQRIRLIEEAFSRASGAQQPIKRRSAMQSFSSNAGFLDHAFGQDLDALSLRTRAVQAMLPLDSSAARRLFSEIPAVDVPLVPCDDYMVYDVDRYYETLADVERHAFTAEEGQNGAQVQFLLQKISVIASPVQLAPAVRAILASTLSGAEFPGVVAAFTAALRKMTGDDRSFTYALPGAGAQVAALIEECQRRRISPLQLIEAYRLYLVSSFSTVRCADDDIDERSADAILFFNQRIRRSPIQPIQSTEAAAYARTGAAGGMRTCESSECQALARQYRALIFNPAGMAFPLTLRETAEWREKFGQFLAALAGWPDSSGPEAAQQFREKAAFYSELAGLPRDGGRRQLAVRALLEFLMHSRSLAQSRMEWFLPVNTLIGRMGLDPLGLGRSRGDLDKADDAVIALYAELERVAPRTAPDVLRLM